MSKNYFGVLDSRNNKYQGLIKDDHFSGIGILVDYLYTFVLSKWKHNSLNDSTLVIFPNLQILFGTMQNNQPKGLLSYQLSNSQKLILKYQNFNQRNQSQPSNAIFSIAYIMSHQSVVHLQKNLSSNQYKINQTYHTKSQEQQLKTLMEIFKMQVLKQHIDLVSFLNKNFVEQSNLFQLTGKNQSKNQIFFGYKNTASLGIKIQSNNPASYGYFNSFPRNLIFGRKVHYNVALPSKTYIQEGHFEQPVKIFQCLKQKKSSTQSQKFTQEYFKKSTTFRNQFIKLDYIQQLHNELKNIYQNVKIQAAKKFGQALLQNDYGSSKNQPQNQVITKQYTLQEIKQQIYKAAAKKQNSYRNNTVSPIRVANRKNIESEYLNSIDSDQKYFKARRKIQQYENIRREEQLRKEQLLRDIQLSQELNRKFSGNQNSNYTNKDQLITQVNKIIEQQKQYQKILLKELIKEKQTLQRINLSTKQRLNNYSYENSSSTKRTYRRYQPNTSNFNLELNHHIKDIGKLYEVSSKRNYKYLPEQQIKSTTRNKSPYQVIRRAQTYKRQQIKDQGFKLNNGLRRDYTQKSIKPFEINQYDQDKEYSNLSKYKQRRKQFKINQFNKYSDSNNSNQLKKTNQNRYQYVNQNELQNNQNKMKQIKLFGPNGFQRSKSKLKLENSYQLQNSYRQNQHKQIRKRSPVLYDRTNQIKYQNQINFNRDSLGDKKFNRQVSQYQIGRKSVTPQKLKKTYHYVD